MTSPTIRPSDQPARRQSRSLAPLLALAVAGFLALAVMPSALNVPRTDPATTLEYAPVPPSDERDAPPRGALASLGLAGTATIGSSAEGAVDDATRGTGRGLGKNPSTKRCVGSPARQTEDPLAPPCVAFFEGDNFGRTYEGVTDDEIRIVMYVGNGPRTDVGTRGPINRSPGQYHDLAQPGRADENYVIQAGRIWQRYFNERYQTYGRFVHFHLYFATGASPEARRSDANDNFARIRPFAVVMGGETAGVPYVEAMAARGVLNFGSLEERPASLYQGYPTLVWGYPPSVEQHARQFSSYVCRKVVAHRASVGDPRDTGKTRRIGLLHTSDPRQPSMHLFTKLVRDQTRACGANIVAEATFPNTNTVGAGPYDRASSNMAGFQSAGVTTIVWTQGFENQHSYAAAQIGFFPEWILAGDGVLDDIVTAKYQEPAEWRNAWVVTNQPLVGPRVNEQCYTAAKEADPGLAVADSSIPCLWYNDMRQLFTGIQVAGPRLNPESIDRGFHAIPGNPSSNPKVPACFYDPGDYTCVKDAAVMWWDPAAQSTYSSSTGCWRAVQGGARYFADAWPGGDVAAQRAPDDSCNGYTSGRFFDPTLGPDSPPPQ